MLTNVDQDCFEVNDESHEDAVLIDAGADIEFQAPDGSAIPS